MIVCVDIGGGTIRVGFSEDGKSFVNVVKFPTPQSFETAVERIVSEIKKISDKPEKISIVAPGLLDKENGVMVRWGQNHSWWDKGFFEPLKEVFPSSKLKLEHDTDGAALGEAYFGKGRDYVLFGFMSLSTGIGTVLVNDKKIQPFKVGIEAGHQIININETETWSCGQKGCWEAYASGKGFEKMFGMPAEACDDPEIWKEYSRYIACGVANLFSAWSPEAIIIGGGVALKFDMFKDRLKSETKNFMGMYDGIILDIVKSELDEPGLYGGLVL